MAKINFTDEHLANLRDKIATAVMSFIIFQLILFVL